MDSPTQWNRSSIERGLRRGEAFWREAIERQRASGVVQQEFCRQEGLSLSTFARWSQRLSQRAAIEQLQCDGHFVQLTGATSPSVEMSDAQALHIRLNLGGGLSIEIVRS